MGKLLKIVGFAVGFIPVLGFGQTTEPSSAIEQYRVQSHYGPDEALLSPVFPKDGKVEITGGASLAPLSSLWDSHSFQGSLTYHINRRHSVEPIYYSTNTGKISNFVQTQIADKLATDAERAALSVDIPKQMLAASYFFTPYHAKLHISERSTSHFDTYFGLGVGSVQNQAFKLDGTLGETQWRAGVLVSAGIRMLFTPRFAFRVEARDFIHGSNNFGGSANSHSFQMGASLSMFFGSF